MSIKINKTVLDKIKKSKKNIEFYGYPDSGCSLTSIAILKLLKEPSVYVNLIYQNHNKQILSKIIGQNTIILLTESYSIEMLSNISKTLSKTVKYAVLQMSIEAALEFLGEDELLEVTPNNLRIRKKILSNQLRMKKLHS